MKRNTIITVLLSVFLLSGGALADLNWHTNWDSAAAESKKTGKPILVNFTGSDWCGWCIKLKDEVFSKPAFKTWSDKKVVLLEVDFPSKKPQTAEVKAANQALAKKYGVRGYPTIMFTKHDGKTIGKLGYMEGGPKAWTGAADKVIK